MNGWCPLRRCELTLVSQAVSGGISTARAAKQQVSWALNGCRTHPVHLLSRSSADTGVDYRTAWLPYGKDAKNHAVAGMIEKKPRKTHHQLDARRGPEATRAPACFLLGIHYEKACCPSSSISIGVNGCSLTSTTSLRLPKSGGEPGRLLSSSEDDRQHRR